MLTLSVETSTPHQAGLKREALAELAPAAKEKLAAHDYPGNFVDQEFLPKGLEGTVFYEPQHNKHEDVLKSYLERCWPKYYPKDKDDDQKG